MNSPLTKRGLKIALSTGREAGTEKEVWAGLGQHGGAKTRASFKAVQPGCHLLGWGSGPAPLQPA